MKKSAITIAVVSMPTSTWRITPPRYDEAPTYVGAPAAQQGGPREASHQDLHTR